MVATVVIKEGNGAGPVWTTITSARYCLTDDYDPGSTYPCVIPASGLGPYYSYWKHWALDLSGSFTKINNVRIYTDGANAWTLGTSGGVFLAQKDDGDTTDEGHGCPEGSYDQAAGTTNTGYAIKDGTNGHTYYKSETAAVEDLFSFIEGSPCLIDSTDHTVAELTKAAVTQAVIDEDATQGTMSSETVTLEYDEI